VICSSAATVELLQFFHYRGVPRRSSCPVPGWLLFSRPFSLPAVRAGWASRTLRSIPVQHIEIELGIGDVVQIGENIYTVIDIENGEVTFRIDVAEDFCESAITSRTAK
jgi:hypothetical protein